MKRLIALMLMAGMVITACSGDDAAESSDATFAASDGGGGTDFAEPTPEEEAMADGGGSVEVDFEANGDREVIRRASLQLHAANTRAAFDDIVAMVEAAGGFVANAEVYPTSNEDEQPQISMTLRIPADQLTETMAAIKESADEVVAESQSAEDVTEQFIDLEARLTNLEALETELRALLQEVRLQENADPEKILTVFNELSSVRGQIEQIQGQLNYLEDATSLATLSVQLTQTPSTAPIIDEAWAPVETVRNALGNLVEGLQGVADWTINFALYALPMLLITVGPLVLIGFFVYRRFFRRSPSDPTPAEG
jgi:hypothetical protein